MPDVAPQRLHISRHYGCVRSTKASRKADGRLAMAGLLACGSSVPFRPSRRDRASGICGKRLAAYSCGSSLGFDTSRCFTVFPFILPHTRKCADETIARLKRPKGVTKSTAKRWRNALSLFKVPSGNTDAAARGEKRRCSIRKRIGAPLSETPQPVVIVKVCVRRAPTAGAWRGPRLRPPPCSSARGALHPTCGS